jgi:cytochrome b6-f complex iron-sulfur subunit
MSETRREFVVHSCQTLSLLTVAGIVNACGGDSPTSPSGSSAPALPRITAPVVNNTISLTVDAGSPLANVGAAALVDTSSGGFLVAHTGTDAFVALTAVCTHEGCTITGYDNQTYICPCHSSRYNTSGMVVGGPAPRPLRQFPANASGTTLTVSIV